MNDEKRLCAVCSCEYCEYQIDFSSIEAAVVDKSDNPFNFTSLKEEEKNDHLLLSPPNTPIYVCGSSCQMRFLEMNGKFKGGGSKEQIDYQVEVRMMADTEQPPQLSIKRFSKLTKLFIQVTDEPLMVSLNQKYWIFQMHLPGEMLIEEYIDNEWVNSPSAEYGSKQKQYIRLEIPKPSKEKVYPALRINYNFIQQRVEKGKKPVTANFKKYILIKGNFQYRERKDFDFYISDLTKKTSILSYNMIIWKRDNREALRKHQEFDWTLNEIKKQMVIETIPININASVGNYLFQIGYESSKSSYILEEEVNKGNWTKSSALHVDHNKGVMVLMVPEDGFYGNIRLSYSKDFNVKDNDGRDLSSTTITLKIPIVVNK